MRNERKMNGSSIFIIYKMRVKGSKLSILYSQRPQPNCKDHQGVEQLNPYKAILTASCYL